LKKSFHLNDFPLLKKFLEEKWNKKLIDYIFYNKDKLHLINAFVVHEAKTSFDHLPVMAEFVLTATEKTVFPQRGTHPDLMSGEGGLIRNI